MALLPHNEKIYTALEKAYLKNQSILLIHGTGLGKSFLFLELANMLKGKKILFVIPKYAVQQGISEYDDYKAAGVDVTFKTYNYFNTVDKAIKVVCDYDVFVFDEAHHLGSSLYGKNAREIFNLIEGTDKKILGMTATNVREDHVNIEEYFSKTVHGLSTFDAIRNGLIPPFEYLVCRDSGAEMADKKEKDYKKVIDYYDSLPLLSETVCKNKRNRWLCFFTSIKELEEHESTIKELFSDEYTFIKITSKHDAVVSEISEHENTVVLCVDKLLEGIHIPKTQGIILFRNVQSLPVFQQILGRVVHVGEKEPPIVIDCTRSAIKILAKLLKENELKGNESKKGVSNKQILYCSLSNTEHFNLTKLLALTTTSWADEEVEIMKKYYPTEGTRVSKRLKGRTPLACKAFAQQAGIRYIVDKSWSEEENEILREYYPTEGRDVVKRLPKRSLSAVRNQINKLGIKVINQSAYTNDEIEKLRELYPKMGQRCYKDFPGRTKESIIQKAVQLGITKAKTKPFDEKELQYIRDNIDKGFETIATALGRNADSVRKKAKKIGAYTPKSEQRWSEDEIKQISEMYMTGNFTIPQIAEAISRPYASVNGKLAQLRKAGKLTKSA